MEAKYVEKIMRKEVLTVKEKTSIYDAVALMTMNDIGALLVINTLGRPLGIFTERDVLKRVVLAGLQVRHEIIANVYTKKLVSVKPKDLLQEAAKKMKEGHFRHLTVAGDDGKIVGILSARDLVGIYAGK
ncbi:MAG: CBS domain-containing protein [Candidatus Omnitrophica bacterium]|nr:CBS domain-containing protein [Candidatus Omnitrophota bacterium]